MKTIVDSDLCIACGLCVCSVPEVFEYQEDGMVKGADTIPDSCMASVESARAACPVNAISIEKED